MEEKKTPWQLYKESKAKGESQFYDILKPSTEWASEEETLKRYTICKTCPDFVKITKQCKNCGCFMPTKTKLQNTSCPIGKW